jgi:Na+-translocating ferredoxin:NAD+ oxidoreductase subunit D
MTANETQVGSTAHLAVAPAPHVASRAMTTRRMMVDVMIALAPVLVTGLCVFRQYLLRQVGICVASCLAAELIFTAMRRQRVSVGDGSAVITGLILALSLPGPAPWYVGVIGSFAAIGIGKIVFGGLGQNIFNPAMVGRAFVTLAFASAIAAGGYVDKHSTVQAITQATPMTLAKEGGEAASLGSLFWGTTNGSLGETSAFACLLGGLYLCLRRTASWEIPAGMIAAAAVIGGLQNILHPNETWTVAHHLLGGALLFGAFFIATDPVTSPLTPRGKWIFGLGVGAMVMLLRILSRMPEGVMFSVLFMNGLVPLINRWTVPRPVGGPVPATKA